MRLSTYLLFAIGLTSTACESPQPGTLVPFDEACSEKYDADEAKQVFHRVTVEGYLASPGMFTMCSHGSCSMQLAPSPDAKGSLMISLKDGGGKNAMDKLTKDFKLEDVKVTTNDGKRLGIGDKVRVTGQRLGKKADNSCSLYEVDLIEAGS